MAVRCYTCGVMLMFSQNNKAILTYHLKQEHPNIYETYQKYRRRRVPRSIQMESQNNLEKTPIMARNDDIQTLTIEAKKDEIPSVPVEITKDCDPALNQQNIHLAPYVKMLFEPPYFKIVSIV